MRISELKNGLSCAEIDLNELGNMAEYDPETNTVKIALSAWSNEDKELNKLTYYEQDFNDRLDDDPEILERWPELADEKYAKKVIDKYADLRDDANSSWDECLDAAIGHVSQEIMKEREKKNEIVKD